MDEKENRAHQTTEPRPGSGLARQEGAEGKARDGRVLKEKEPGAFFGNQPGRMIELRGQSGREGQCQGLECLGH